MTIRPGNFYIHENEIGQLDLVYCIGVTKFIDHKENEEVSARIVRSDSPTTVDITNTLHDVNTFLGYASLGLNGRDWVRRREAAIKATWKSYFEDEDKPTPAVP
jgi:hypothetical protein